MSGQAALGVARGGSDDAEASSTEPSRWPGLPGRHDRLVASWAEEQPSLKTTAGATSRRATSARKEKRS